MSRHAWRDRAACRGVPIEVFFPEIPPGDQSTRWWRQARQYCEGCPVKLDCLNSELPHEEATGRRNGMWGGLTPKEREQYVNRPQPFRFR
jgi:WhiB family redox-sensing transcriptional regulator